MKSDCTDVAMLARYIDGNLSEPEKNEMEKHLLACDECMEEFVMAKKLLNNIDFTEYEPGPADIVQSVLGKVKEKIKNIIKWVTDDLTPPVWMLQYNISPVRSGVEFHTVSSAFVKKRMGELKTEMYIQKSKADKICVWIKVFKGRKDAKSVSLTLTKEGGRPLARFLNEGYEFFDKLNFGTYALVLEQQTHEKGVFLFQIDDKGIYEK